MHWMEYRIDRVLTIACLLAIGFMGGCSTLGLSLYPSHSTLTTEAKEVLEASRIPGGLARENAKMVLPPHAIEPGDSLLIEPVDLDRDLRLPADQIVLADGTIDLGPYGRLVVAGHDLEQAESLIEQQIVMQIRKSQQQCDPVTENDSPRSNDAFDQSPDCDTIAVNVRMLEPVHRFYVLGEVNAPGSYPLSGYETVLDAIVGAGGLTTSANPCKILLARPTDPCECRVTLPVCYREIVQMGNTTSNYQLQPGDRIFVSNRSCMDELMFWRAGRPCERCAGCNHPCASPGLVTARPMPAVASPMIAPGSVGWADSENQPLRSAGLLEASGPLEGSSGQPMGFSELLRPGNPTPAPKSKQSEVDGELEFPSTVESGL